MSKIKRPSLLLEILLAFALLALFIVPLIKAPLETYQRQMNALKEGEKQRLADIAFAEIKLQLLNHQIPWKELPGKKDPPKIIDLSQTALQIPYSESIPIERRASLKCTGEKLTLQGDIVRLLKIEIEFEPFSSTKKGETRYIYRTSLIKKAS